MAVSFNGSSLYGIYVALGASVSVGLVVGDCVGLVVGAEVGDCVGLVVGAEVGDCVGLVVGAEVGDCVGLVVGAEVGDCVGLSVGLVVGDVVATGASVGDGVGSSGIGSSVGGGDGVGSSTVGASVGDGLSVFLMTTLTTSVFVIVMEPFDSIEKMASVISSISTLDPNASSTSFSRDFSFCRIVDSTSISHWTLSSSQRSKLLLMLTFMTEP